MHKDQILHFLYTIAQRFKIFLYNFLAPGTCSYCAVFLSGRQVFCDECVAHITPVISREIFVTSTRMITVYAKGLYQDPLKKLIVAKRWNCIISSKQLAQVVMSIPNINFDDFDYIIPIPLHWKRHALRGFNQAYEMAIEVQKVKKIELVDILRRTKNTQFQSDLSHEQRIDNLKDAFELTTKNAALFFNKKLLIIDDVMTTGTTIKEVAKILFTLKPHSIAAVVACRT